MPCHLYQISSFTREAIVSRVRNGVDHGSFIEHVANRDWERALNCADAANQEVFKDIMLFRLLYLPSVAAPLDCTLEDIDDG